MIKFFMKNRFSFFDVVVVSLGLYLLSRYDSVLLLLAAYFVGALLSVTFNICHGEEK